MLRPPSASSPSAKRAGMGLIGTAQAACAGSYRLVQKLDRSFLRGGGSDLLEKHTGKLIVLTGLVACVSISSIYPWLSGAGQVILALSCAWSLLLLALLHTVPEFMHARHGHGKGEGGAPLLVRVKKALLVLLLSLVFTFPLLCTTSNLLGVSPFAMGARDHTQELSVIELGKQTHAQHDGDIPPGPHLVLADGRVEREDAGGGDAVEGSSNSLDGGAQAGELPAATPDDDAPVPVEAPFAEDLAEPSNASAEPRVRINRDNVGAEDVSAATPTPPVAESPQPESEPASGEGSHDFPLDGTPIPTQSAPITEDASSPLSAALQGDKDQGQEQQGQGQEQEGERDVAPLPPPGGFQEAGISHERVGEPGDSVVPAQVEGRQAPAEGEATQTTPPVGGFVEAGISPVAAAHDREDAPLLSQSPVQTDPNDHRPAAEAAAPPAVLAATDLDDVAPTPPEGGFVEARIGPDQTQTQSSAKLGQLVGAVAGGAPASEAPEPSNEPQPGEAAIAGGAEVVAGVRPMDLGALRSAGQDSAVSSSPATAAARGPLRRSRGGAAGRPGPYDTDIEGASRPGESSLMRLERRRREVMAAIKEQLSRGGKREGPRVRNIARPTASAGDDSAPRRHRPQGRDRMAAALNGGAAGAGAGAGRASFGSRFGAGADRPARPPSRSDTMDAMRAARNRRQRLRGLDLMSGDARGAAEPWSRRLAAAAVSDQPGVDGPPRPAVAAILTRDQRPSLDDAPAGEGRTSSADSLRKRLKL